MLVEQQNERKQNKQTNKNLQWQKTYIKNNHNNSIVRTFTYRYKDVAIVITMASVAQISCFSNKFDRTSALGEEYSVRWLAGGSKGCNLLILQRASKTVTHMLISIVHFSSLVKMFINNNEGNWCLLWNVSELKQTNGGSWRLYIPDICEKY